VSASGCCFVSAQEHVHKCLFLRSILVHISVYVQLP
jgi:hypothetical protein